MKLFHNSSYKKLFIEAFGEQNQWTTNQEIKISEKKDQTNINQLDYKHCRVKLKDSSAVQLSCFFHIDINDMAIVFIVYGFNFVINVFNTKILDNITYYCFGAILRY